MGYLRTSLLPGLMRAADFNVKNGNCNFRLFELAHTHEQDSEGFEGIKEHKYLAGVIYGLEKIQSVHQNPYQEESYLLWALLMFYVC